MAAVVWDPLRDEMYTAERGGGAWRNGTRLSVTGRPGLDGAFVATGFPFRNRHKIDSYLALFKAVFVHARAIRRAGSAALDLAYVAAGVFDGFFEFRLAPWDVAAGALLISEAGGVLTDFDGGTRYLERGNVVAAPWAWPRTFGRRPGNRLRRHDQQAAEMDRCRVRRFASEAMIANARSAGIGKCRPSGYGGEGHLRRHAPRRCWHRRRRASCI